MTPEPVADAIAREMSARNVPGVSVATVEDGALAWADAYGVRAVDGEPTTVDTVFEAASISKPVFAWWVLGLCERGVLDLDAPLSRYTTDRVVLDHGADVITARMVLSHTSALSWEFTGRGDEGRLSLSGTPGAVFRYSNAGFECLRALVRQLTGQPTRDELHRFMSELAMTRSSYAWDASFEDDYASPHDLEGNVCEKEKSGRLKYVSAELHSTAPDLAAFLCELVRPDQPPTHAEALKPHVDVHQGFLKGAPGPGAHWGLGIGVWLVDGRTTVWHWGENPGFQSILIAWPDERRGIVVLTNSDHGHWVSRAAVQAFAGLDHPAFRWIEN
ncbi:MAG: serine hydrolase domain-containing protein [Actinomycetota bacterium]